MRGTTCQWIFRTTEDGKRSVRMEWHPTTEKNTDAAITRLRARDERTGATAEPLRTVA